MHRDAILGWNICSILINGNVFYMCVKGCECCWIKLSVFCGDFKGFTSIYTCIGIRLSNPE